MLHLPSDVGSSGLLKPNNTTPTENSERLTTGVAVSENVDTVRSHDNTSTDYSNPLPIAVATREIAWPNSSTTTENPVLPPSDGNIERVEPHEHTSTESLFRSPDSAGYRTPLRETNQRDETVSDIFVSPSSSETFFDAGKLKLEIFRRCCCRCCRFLNEYEIVSDGEQQEDDWTKHGVSSI